MDEKDRVWRLLIDEVELRILSIKRWESYKEFDKETKEMQIYGFNCELTALIVLGTKIFDLKEEDIINHATNRCNQEVSKY